MFGYIMPDKPELKIKEYELFRGYYCGVCKSMGRSFGTLSRFALNYDSVFLGLLLSAVHNETPVLKKESCIANPVKKKWIVKESPHIDYAADINVLLTYYKLMDNIRDEGGALPRLAHIAFKRGYNNAASRNKHLDGIIAASIDSQVQLEEQACSSMDEAAEPFANMLSQLLAAGNSGGDRSVSRVLGWIGYNLGKWIYIIDAFDDIEKDIKSGSYNPLLKQYKYDNQNIEVFKAGIADEVRMNLMQALSQTTGSIELLKLTNKGIIDNILYEGLYGKTEKILSCITREKRSCEKDEKSVRSIGN
ncbi:MAG TPA: DUF5685 family protein [Clostridia bacterium]|nr:DUF5685 family protein [Clostridia bacterium]